MKQFLCVCTALLCLGARTASSFQKISGYTPVSDVSSTLSVGKSLEAIDAALKKDPKDWTAATRKYKKTLRSIPRPPTGGDKHFKVFSDYYGSEDYVHEFVLPALKGTGKFNLNAKARHELTMKGIVLQGVVMQSISHLHKAASLCREKKLDAASGAPHHVDEAWALYASSQTHGPIKLAEKRAPQFATEATSFTEAGTSKVNSHLLKYFKELQTNAKEGKCTEMDTLIAKSTAQIQVPIIQGMLREAYEVDPKAAGQLADGFIEVVEGWAFARAVLPSIAKCSSTAAATIKRNMDTIALGEKGAHLPEGYATVKAAVESTYRCLGISCIDVNAMVNPFKTGKLLWEPCSDAKLAAQKPKEPAISGATSKAPLIFSTAMALAMSIKLL